MLPIKQLLAAAFAVLNLALLGCVSVVVHDERTFFECRIEPMESGRVQFTLKNISNRRLAVLQWNVPVSNEPLSRYIFTVHQGHKEIPYEGVMAESGDYEAAIRFMEPAEVVTAVVPIRNSYRAQSSDAISVKYDSCLNFAVVGKSGKKISRNQLKHIECITSNAVLVK